MKLSDEASLGVKSIIIFNKKHELDYNLKLDSTYGHEFRRKRTFEMHGKFLKILFLKQLNLYFFLKHKKT